MFLNIRDSITAYPLFNHGPYHSQGFGLTKSKLNFSRKHLLVVFSLLIMTILSILLCQRLLISPANADPLTYPHPPLEESTISLTKPDDINITIDPTPTGDNISTAFNSTDVTTTNLTGYNLTLNTTSTDNKLTHTSLDTNYINPLASNNTELIASTWGYTTTNPTTPSTALFNTVPTNQSPTTLKTTTEPNSTTAGTTPDTTTVYYGAKVDFTKPAGNYTNTIVYTAVGNLVDSLTVTNISPATGHINGGDTLTLTGTNFDSITNITLGDTDCTNISITSATTATCVTPAHAAGVVDVIVAGQGGVVTESNGFTFVDPAPTVTSITPNSGHFRGGETFTITGTNLTGATVVNLGGSACRSYTVISDTEIKCVSSGVATSLQTAYTTGAGSLMTNPTNAVSVNVTTPNGTNAGNLLFTYRYSNSSLTTGSSYVDIMGEDIVPGSKIYVGGVECKEQKITGNGTAACVTPALGNGNQNITIVAPASATTDIQNFAEVCYYNSAVDNNIGTIRTLRDSRDGQNYRVRCMEDAHWWMIDNLKLAGGTTLNSTNTDLDDTANAEFISTWASLTAPVLNSSTHGNGACTSDSSVTIDNGTGYLTCDGLTYSDDNDGFVAYSDPAQATTYSAWVCNNQIMINEESLTNCGYLYNWYSATAGSGNYQMDSYVTASICPAGWNMPYDDGTNDFGVLNNSMLNDAPSSSSITNSASARSNWRYNGKFQGSLSGNYVGSTTSQGQNSNYWTARSSSAVGVYYYNLSYGTLAVSQGSLKHYGYGIRCMI